MTLNFDYVFMTKMDNICQLKASKLVSSFLLNVITCQMTANLDVEKYQRLHDSS
jgi:hypothetical protein